MPERWPRFEELPHHLTETKPMPGYIGGPPGRRAVISESQYAEARRAIEAQEELIQALTAAILAFRLATMRDHTASPLIAEWGAVLRRVKGAEDA